MRFICNRAANEDIFDPGLRRSVSFVLLGAKMKFRLFPLFALVAWVPLLQADSLLNDLNEAQRLELEHGGQVVIMQEMEGKPWPRVRLYQRVDATPEDVAAVFFDYQNAKSFIPKVIKSDISRQVSPCILEVDYGIDIPILPDEFYTARNELTAGKDGSYCVSWNLVRALQTKASEGSLYIERFGEGSVIRYTNLVTPGSSMAVILKVPAIDQMRGTVRAIVRQVERQKKEHPEALKKEILSLQEALSKKPQE